MGDYIKTDLFWKWLTVMWYLFIYLYLFGQNMQKTWVSSFSFSVWNVFASACSVNYCSGVGFCYIWVINIWTNNFVLLFCSNITSFMSFGKDTQRTRRVERRWQSAQCLGDCRSSNHELWKCRKYSSLYTRSIFCFFLHYNCVLWWLHFNRML